MEKVLNKKNKRVCDLSDDHTFADIIRDGCLTRISAGKDGLLMITNSLIVLEPQKDE
jgi:hypothetical protein